MAVCCAALSISGLAKNALVGDRGQLRQPAASVTLAMRVCGALQVARLKAFAAHWPGRTDLLAER